jgi:EpsI family protein
MRFGVTATLLLATGAYVLLHPPENLALGRGVLAACPAALGPWNGTELSFEDAVVEELDADDLLVRRYQREGQTVWLCIVYHRNRRYGAHDPRLCYESQGYLLEPTTRRRVDDGGAGLTVNRFVAERGRDRRVVYFWWATSGLATADVGAFRQRMALHGALENRSWGAFVRVEARVRTGDDAAADVAAADFGARVARALPQVFASGAPAAQPGATPAPAAGAVAKRRGRGTRRRMASCLGRVRARANEANHSRQRTRSTSP